MGVCHNILGLVGKTPMIRLNRVVSNIPAVVMAKLECFNPSGSTKDRIVLSMVLDAERRGLIHPGITLVEATSGNTGIGLAVVTTVKGYKLLLTMPESVSTERRKILKALGAEIVLTPADKGTDGAIEEAYELARQNPQKYCLMDQFNNEHNWIAHYKTTAPEIWKQTEGKVTMFVAGMGTTGTLMGVGRYLKQKNPMIRVIGVEPYLDHKIQGLKNMREAYKPGIYDRNVIDEKINVYDEDAYEMTRRLAKKEGLFVGMSSGAAMHVALHKAEELNEGLIVVLFPDGGERYLSTNLFLE